MDVTLLNYLYRVILCRHYKYNTLAVAALIKTNKLNFDFLLTMTTVTASLKNKYYIFSFIYCL